ncbi:m-phase inducer phosphatase [Ophidiomyces ophidiicola]|uniref:M-phase inducer phosphatase n=1 Tax=Ophidiomyces ophidiicola TaxID=1387563 RepID=A0ACB8UV14_9EURO|nr:m-phase inducer phosphatase [Ophidiomyces ophidiicola]KAI1934722.1 m-phase inducer phosphatase [Ophidiomyces ophidiicola]KAI1952345.1 m-phase inducer phosphatase [Ophidiomyces ophidiicola]KAI1969202.1 m-phase inducer phosphatase [Ophidiomyces ophidiicola]KAI2000190.1 m-phase inducer phosphatase [Ophidiomyces ophidiicola]
MQPPSVMFGHHFGTQAKAGFSSFPIVRKFGPESFNFKDLSMKTGHADYFTANPHRGSSPTVSLAADLSQNFHIDRSPQLVTPRRSLFTASLLGPDNGRGKNAFLCKNKKTGYEQVLVLDTMTTPPMPPSSPARGLEIMEMSPLPHKIPYCHNADLDLDSPTAEISLAKAQQSHLQRSLQASPMDLEPPGRLQRAKPPMLRPSLIRSKAYSSNDKDTLVPQPPPFKFAAGSRITPCASLSLSEMFEESPPRNLASKPNISVNSMGPPRPRAPFSGVVGQSRSNGSPANGIRKSPNPFCRPRKLSRRSLSMFEHPEDIVNQDEDSIMLSSPGLQSIADIDTRPQLQLPHFIPEDVPDQLPRIESSVLVDIINGKYNDRYDNITIIDCRFEYEYEGGHINGAVNYNDKEHLATQLFGEEFKPKTALIFHCEYSAHRAPIMAKYIRHKDRAVNVDIYPELTYPEMYILYGGYSAFFSEHRSLCYPQNYVEMAAKEHEFACERGLGKVKQRSKLSRAQTFAFGQNSLPMEDSPTGRCRATSDRSVDPGSFDQDSAGSRISGRRMFSY